MSAEIVAENMRREYSTCIKFAILKNDRKKYR